MASLSCHLHTSTSPLGWLYLSHKTNSHTEAPSLPTQWLLGLPLSQLVSHCVLGFCLFSLVFFFLTVLVFELMILCLLGRCPRDMPPALFSYFSNRVSFLRLGGLDHSPPIYASCVVGMTGTRHQCPAFYLSRWDIANFLPRLAWNHNPPK
jgi:hypothetical protein